MTTLLRVITFALITVTAVINAQDFQGVATYKTHRDFDIKMDSTKMNSDMQKQIMAQMKKQFQKTFNLTFNREESIYKEEESLDAPQIGGHGMEVVMVGSGGADVLYKNTKNQTYTDQKDTMGKVFLVKDSIEKIDWKLEKEQKYIGEYLCFKATYIKQLEVRRNINFNSNSKAEVEDKESEEAPKMEDRVVTAWYTPQIPVSNGPDNYQGLPGLILEIHDGRLTVICSKITLNPEEKIDIEEPTKGKEVNRAEYKNIMEKKTKEMMERYAPRKDGRDGEGIEIRIKG